MNTNNERYVTDIEHGTTFGFPKKTAWCDVIKFLGRTGRWAWFHEITRDLDDGRVEVAKLGDCLMLAGYSYLGLNRRPELREAVMEALDTYGTGSAGSRWLAGHTTVHRELEERLAAVHGTEDSITFTSGFATNIAVITAMVGRRDAVFGDRINHASLVDGCLHSGAEFKRFRNNDVDQLESLLQKSTAKRKFVVVDGVASMDGLVCDAPGLTRVCRENEALLMVDECHSHFVLGPTGGGVSEHHNLQDNNPIDLEMGSLGKALYSTGGYIAASQDMCNFLRRTARGFIYSGSVSPMGIASSIAALKIFEAERVELVGRLRDNTKAFCDALNSYGLKVDQGPSAIVPIPVGPAVAAAGAAAGCQQNGVFIHPVSPPVVPKGKSILRASIMASHRPSDLEAAAKLISEQVAEALDKCTPEEAALL